MEPPIDLPPSCYCDECKKLCYRPCWGTPEEAEYLIDNGYAHQMMADYWVSDGNIYIICPAHRGHEGDQAPNWPYSDYEHRCILQDELGQCTIHDHKPMEGRYAIHGKTPEYNMHKHCAMLWDTDKGRDVVRKWAVLVKADWLL